MTTMGIIFANIYDSSLGELTNKRTMASLPYGGRYRQIDFILSNMANSGIRDIGIITKYNYQSLMDHLGNCDEWDLKLGDGVRFLPPYATGHTGAYRGKLEALQTALPVLERNDSDYVVLADTTVLCTINFLEVLEKHVESGCDITVVSKAGKCDGVKPQQLAMKLDENGNLVDLAAGYSAPEEYLVGMSMFIMERKKLISVIRDMVPHGKYHFERDFILQHYLEGRLKVNVYPFHNVALFNESTTEFFHNSLALIRPEIRHGLFAREDLTIYTKVRDSVPTLFGEHGQASDCLVADGCHIFGKANHSVIFREVDLDEDTEVESSVLMQGSKVGARSKLRYVILDKNVTVKPDTKLQGTPEHPLYISKGVTV